VVRDPQMCSDFAAQEKYGPQAQAASENLLVFHDVCDLEELEWVN